MRPSLNTATANVDFRDSGVASAMVSTVQQVGGSIGIAVLSTFAARSTSAYLSQHATGGVGAALTRAGATHGYTFAFARSAAVFLIAAVLCGPLIRSQPPRVPTTGPYP